MVKSFLGAGRWILLLLDRAKLAVSPYFHKWLLAVASYLCRHESGINLLIYVLARKQLSVYFTVWHNIIF